MQEENQTQQKIENVKNGQHKPVIPIGTILIVGFLFLNIVFFWMLTLGVQQGRA